MEPYGMHVLEIPNENGKRTLLLLLSSSSPCYFKCKTHPTFKKGSSLFIKYTTLLVRPVLRGK
jgi:serine acetyltransferase